MAVNQPLDDIKTMLGFSDTSKDAMLALLIRKAGTLITNYLNIPTVATTDPCTQVVTQPIDINTSYPDAVIEYVTICWNRRGNEGIKQASQGSRSATFENSLPDGVKALLPAPFAKMLRTAVYHV